MEFLQSHKNRIFDEIIAVGLDPSDFEMEPFYISRNKWNQKIEHRPSGSALYFYTHHVYYRPGRIDSEEQVDASDMRARLSVVPVWLKALARELNEPDKWAEWDRAKAGLYTEIAADDVTEPLSNEEQMRLLEGLTELRQNIGELETTKETRARVLSLLDTAIEEVKEGSSRSSRVALGFFLLGILIHIISLFGHSPIIQKACIELLHRFIAKVPFLLLIPPPTG